MKWSQKAVVGFEVGIFVGVRILIALLICLTFLEKTYHEYPPEATIN